MKHIRKYNESIGEDLDFQMFKNLFGDFDNCQFHDESTEDYPNNIFSCGIEIGPIETNVYEDLTSSLDQLIGGGNVFPADCETFPFERNYPKIIDELGDDIENLNSQIKNLINLRDNNLKLLEIIEEINQVVMPRMKEYKNYHDCQVAYISNDNILQVSFMIKEKI